MRRLGARGAGALPVMDRGRGRLVGLLSRSDVLGLYGRILAGAPDGAEASSPGASAGGVSSGSR